MNLKKLAVAGTLAFVIFGCVMAAGCTSVQETADVQITGEDPIVGVWGAIFTDNDIGISVEKFYPDGTGTEEMLYAGAMSDDYTFTWKNIGDGTYQLTYGDGSVWEAKIADDDQPLVWKVIDNKDQIIGSRSSTYIKNGATITDVTTFKPDYTGVSVGTYVDSPDKEPLNQAFTWVKAGENLYLLTYEHSSRWYAAYDPETNVVTYTKVDYVDDPIIGTRFDVDAGTTTGVDYTYIFEPNGTGREIQKLAKFIPVGEYEFVWAPSEEENIYNLAYPSSTALEFWTIRYDPQTGALDDWTLLQDSWLDNSREGGRHLLEMHYVKDYNTDNGGIAFEYGEDLELKTYETSWKAVGLNQFTVTYPDGDVWNVIYLPLSESYIWIDADE